MDKKDDISQLKKELNDLGSEKEKLMSQKEELKKTTSELINKAKDMKKLKDDFNTKLNQLKTERDSYNAKVRELVAQIKVIQQKKKDAYNKLGIKGDPSQIKEKIKSLHQKVETEVLKFDKEKQIMLEIKKLEKQYDECKDVKSVDEEYRKLSDEIDKNKKLGEEAHKKVNELLRSNRRGYRDFIALTKKITNLKAQQDMIYNVFRQVGDKFNSINHNLRGRITDLTTRNKQEQKQKDVKFKKEEEKIIEQRVNKVEEKLKKKKTLTTEDLIAYQGKNDDEK